MATADELVRLRHQAAELRLRIVTMMGANKAHHFGGSLSAADVITALYFYAMSYDPQDPNWPGRDRFLMSKGHAVPAQYAALAMLGVIPLEELPTLKLLGSRLQGHPAMHETPGKRADWITEGIAEYYGLEIMRRSGTLSEERFQQALAELARWSAEIDCLPIRHSTGPATAYAVTVFRALDLELGERRLDHLVQLPPSDLNAFQIAAAAELRRPAEALAGLRECRAR